MTNDSLDHLVGALWDAMLLLFSMADATNEEKMKAFKDISEWSEGHRRNLLREEAEKESGWR